jgi:hypothetical protein
MAEVEKTDPLTSILGDGYSKLDQAGKVAAAGSFLKSRDEADKAAKGEAGQRAEGKLISEFGPSLYSKPYEEFKPSQETMSGFAALGSLMMVAGTMMGSKGRLAGIGAMNNIAGMLKGYQSGRKDLYEQERQQFEENMKVQERNRADIKEAFNLALKMAPTNLRGAEDFLNKTFASKGMSMPQAMLKTSGVMHTIGTVNGALDKADNITKQLAESLGYQGVTSRKDLEARIAAQGAGTAAQTAAEKGTPEYGVITNKDGTQEKGMFLPSKIFKAQNEGGSFEKLSASSNVTKNLQEYTWTENGQKKTEPLSVEEALAKRDQEGVADFQKAPTRQASAQNQRFAFNVREAFAQTAQDLKNVTLMPKDTVLGAFSGLTGQAGSGLVDSLRNVFAREVTPEDQRQFQILISGFENNLSRALGGGYANSGSARAVDAYKTQVAREGDSPSAKALFLARAKQELNILSEAYDTYPGVTPEDTNFIKKYTDVINQAVPFDVADVVIASPRSSAKLGSKKVATEEDILATMAGQNLNRNETIKKLKASGFTIEGE